MAIAKLNPTAYITDTDPVPEAVLDASSWFETEYATITWNETLGDPDLSAWYMAQGWMITSRLRFLSHIGKDSSENQYSVTVTMKRRKLQSERVLQDMITEFTDAYNEGRSINDRRYDELVSLYNLLLDNTETTIATVTDAATAYEALITAVVDALPSDYTTHESTVTGMLDDWGDGRRQEINTQFDNELAKAEQALVDRGMYNSTVWTSVSAGIETQRAKALTDLEDKIADKQVALKDRLYTFKMDMRAKMLAAYERLMANKKDDPVLRHLEMRNTVFANMLAFMERRQDDYPGLEGLANIAAQLGYGEGGSVMAPNS